MLHISRFALSYGKMGKKGKAISVAELEILLGLVERILPIRSEDCIEIEM